MKLMAKADRMDDGGCMMEDGKLRRKISYQFFILAK